VHPFTVPYADKPWLLGHPQLRRAASVLATVGELPLHAPNSKHAAIPRTAATMVRGCEWIMSVF
jgi:hypothetical protein